VPPVARKALSAAQIPTDGIQWLAERILYEDAKVLVLDKPAGLAVHGGSGVPFGCIEALRSLKPSLRKADLVHRLDRGTSGCLLVAKRRSALRQLHSLLREGAMEKRYLALLRGQWQHGQTDVELPLAVARRGGEAYVQVDSAGKTARSSFRVVDQFGSRATLMEIVIATGRTHQIRVHAAHAGHPIAGDERYGDASFNASLASLGLRRPFLHAHAVEFVWPDSEEVFAVSAPLPAELSAVLDVLRRQPRGRGGPRRNRAGRGITR
jgi:23S rRNA pseudouridine955/2504/2580 synthase